MVRHWQGYNFAKCSNFSSSSRVHSVFLIDGSSHSYQRALHCFADFLLSKEATLAHWFLPYFMTAAFRISSSVFFQTPPLIMMRIFDQGRRGPRAPGLLLARCSAAARRGGRLDERWGGAAVVRARPARLGHLLRYCSAGRRAASTEQRKLFCEAGRGGHACRSALTCAASLLRRRRVFACLLVGLQHASSVESARP